MVKSSRGNPYRYPKGAPNGRGGQFAPKGTGVKEEKPDEYYEDRTLDRTPMGILKWAFTRVSFLLHPLLLDDLITTKSYTMSTSVRFGQPLPYRIGFTHFLVCVAPRS